MYYNENNYYGRDSWQASNRSYLPNTHEAYAPGPGMSDFRYNEGYFYRAISMEEAIGIARQQVPGQVVEAELKRKGNRLIYEVEIVTDANVKYEVKIDYNTGQVIEVELD